MDRQSSPSLVPRRRRRGEPSRRFNDEDRPRVALQAPDPKITTKNPSRIIPDHPGFSLLDKLEMKKDSRTIDKSGLILSCLADSDEENDEDNTIIIRTVRPPTAPETTVMRKKRRYMTWVANPSAMQTDIQSYQTTIDAIQDEVRAIELEEERWLDSFEIARRRLTSSFTACRTEKARLVVEFNHLQQLCQQEIDNPRTNACITVIETTNGNQSRKKRSNFMRDLAYELVEREDVLAAKLAEYERLVTKANTKSLLLDNNSFLFDIQMNDTVDEDEYLNEMDGLGNVAIMTDSSADFYTEVGESKLESELLLSPQSAITLKVEGEIIDKAATFEKITEDCINAVDEEQVMEEEQSEERLAEKEAMLKLLLNIDSKLKYSEGSIGDVENFFSLDEIEPASDAIVDPFGFTLSPTVPASPTALPTSTTSASAYNAAAAAAATTSTSAKGGKKNVKDSKVTVKDDFINNNINNSVNNSSNYYNDNNSEKNCYYSSLVGGDVLLSMANQMYPLPANEIQEKLSTPFSLIKEESIWSQLIESACDNSFSTANFSNLLALANSDDKYYSESKNKQPTVHKDSNQSQQQQQQQQQLMLRRKKKNANGSIISSQLNIPLSTFISGRTPRGIPLLVSPLSQYNDRYLGALYGVGDKFDLHSTSTVNSSSSAVANNSSSSNKDTLSRIDASIHHSDTSTSCEQVKAAPFAAIDLPIPDQLLALENDTMERCCIISASLAAENKLRKLEQTSIEWNKLSEESNIALQRAEALYAACLRDQYMEKRFNRKELIAFGVATAGDYDPPVSPMLKDNYYISSGMLRPGSIAAGNINFANPLKSNSIGAFAKAKGKANRKLQASLKASNFAASEQRRLGISGPSNSLFEAINITMNNDNHNNSANDDRCTPLNEISEAYDNELSSSQPLSQRSDTTSSSSSSRSRNISPMTTTSTATATRNNNTTATTSNSNSTSINVASMADESSAAAENSHEMGKIRRDSISANNDTTSASNEASSTNATSSNAGNKKKPVSTSRSRR